jgi:hexokinase
MGGTNIRICAVDLHGDATYSLVQDKSVIPAALMITKNHKELFGWVALAVQNFLEKEFPGSTTNIANSCNERTFKLGFTFSHAVHQQSINSGTLIRWSKGFDIDGVVGRDICALLQNAFDDLALPVRVTALINDTVGTLLAQAYSSRSLSRTVLGAVFGTGTNGAYVETTSKITKLEDCHTQSDAMIVNTEWGNFDQGLECLPDTVYDRAIDAGSVNPGFEMFEKRISGMYLGEILRLAILSLARDLDLDLFPGLEISETSALYSQWSLDSSFLSYLECDTTSDLSSSRSQIEQWIGVVPVSIEAARSIRMIAHAIGRRSARLSAVALGAVIVQTNCLSGRAGGDEKISIGVDGSLIELYPGFVAEIRRALRCIEQIGERGEALIDIMIAKDGSGVGAALAAHVVVKDLGDNIAKPQNQ